MTTLPSLTGEPTRHPGCCLSLSEPLLTTIGTLLDTIPRRDIQSGDGEFWGPDSKPPLVLSIGSGTGLLEELLQAHLGLGVSSTGPRAPVSVTPASERLKRPRNWRIEGVEVDPVVNIFLPEDRINHVLGTWAVLETRAREAAALIFVYPRDGALVRRYVDAFMRPFAGARDKRRTGGGQPGEEGQRESARKSEVKSADEGEDDDIKDEDQRGPQLILWLGPKCDWEHTGFASFDKCDELEVLEMRYGVGLAEYEMLAALRQKKTAFVR